MRTKDLTRTQKIVLNILNAFHLWVLRTLLVLKVNSGMMMIKSVRIKKKFIVADGQVSWFYCFNYAHQRKTELVRNINRGYFTECCLIRLGIFTSQFYFFKPLRREKINLTSKTTAVLYNFPCNKMFIIRPGVFYSSATAVKCTPHFNRSSFYGTAELKTWRASNYHTYE